MINLKVVEFDWDDGNREHCRKHGLSLTEIEEVFRSSELLVAPDLGHSDEEDRLLAIGKTLQGRRVFIVFMFRTRHGKRFIRPIMARYMHAKEIKKYEEKESS